MSRARVLAAIALIGSVAALPALAETTRVGEFAIHANAFSSDNLTPEIAQRLGLQRARHRAVLNVSVVKEAAGTLGTSSTALVEAAIVKPEPLKGPIPMREIRDGAAISYLGEFPLDAPATVEFEIRVRPAGAAEAPTLHLSQELFAD